MATITVREYTINKEHYDPAPSGMFPFVEEVAEGGGSVASMNWAGDTANAVATYGGPRSIVAEESLIFTGTKLRQGSVTDDYLNYSYAYTIGGTSVNNITAVEIVGNKTANGTVGSLSFHNESASQSSKMIAQIYAQRDDDDSYGALNINVGGTAGASWAVARMERASHRWFVENSEVLVLDSSRLRPYSSELLELGSSTYPWADVVSSQFSLGASINIREDSAGNMVFTDDNGGPYELSELASGGGYWSRNGTDLSPATSGDDLLLAVTTERIKFGDGDTYIYEPSDDALFITVGGSLNTAFQLPPFDNTMDNTLRPNTDNTYDLGSTNYYWNSLYVNTVYIEDTNTYINQDSAGNMVLYDTITGVKTLAELASAGGGGGDVTASGTLTNNVVMVGNGGTSISIPDADVDFNGYGITNVDSVTLNTGFNLLAAGASCDVGSSGTFFDNAYFTTIYIEDTSTYIRQDSAGNLIFEDINGGPYELSELAAGGGTNYWSRSGTDLSPNTSGDDILLAVSTERIKFGDGDTYIYEDTDDHLYFFCGGSYSAYMNTTDFRTSRDFWPNGDKVQDLGKSTAFWDNGYVNRLYIDSTSVYIDVSGTEMELTDSTGSYTLSDLNAGAGWSRVGTQLQPANSGDDIRLASNTEKLIFGDGDTGIYENADDWLHIYVAAGIYQFTSSYCSFKTIRPSSASGDDLGTNTVRWGNIYSDDLFVGDSTGSGLSPTNKIVCGSTGSDEYGGIELWGNRLSNNLVGYISFMNEQATSASYNRIGHIQCERHSTNHGGILNFYVAASGGSLRYMYSITSDQHIWKIEGTNEMALSATALYPAADAGISLGTSTYGWNGAYIHLPSVAQSYKVVYNTTTEQFTYEADSSDRRLKKNLKPIRVGVVDRLKKIQGYTFNFNKLGTDITGHSTKPLRAGLVAQEVVEQFPEVVHKIGNTDYYNIRYDDYTAILTEAIKEQAEEIDYLRSELDQLKTKVDALLTK